jgi:hypothetical protein
MSCDRKNSTWGSIKITTSSTTKQVKSHRLSEKGFVPTVCNVVTNLAITQPKNGQDLNETSQEV